VLLAGGALTLSALLAARPALAVLGGVLLAVPVLGWARAARRPLPGPLTVALALSASVLDEDATLSVTITVTAPVDLAVVAVAVRARGLVPLGHAGSAALSVRAGEPAALSLRYRPRRWGHAEVGPVTARGVRTGWLAAVPPAHAPGRRILVRARTTPFQPGGAVPVARSHAGAHRARAAGVGDGMRGLRPFQPGDRLGRIDWRAAARLDELPVVDTDSERGTRVVVVVDSGQDIGPPGRTSLDLAVRGATAVARHYLSVGDVVALVEFGGRRRVLAAGSGRAQLERARDWLADCASFTTAAATTVGWPFGFSPAGTLTVVLSALVDEPAATALVQLRLRGTHVVAVDTLSLDALPAPSTRSEALAQRLWVLERTERLARLGDLGVPVARWSGGAGLGPVLAGLTRAAERPRAALR
jgi:uncharacterized protein (DUF58 family)